MAYVYQGVAIEQFLTGTADTVAGPMEGRIPHRVKEKWRKQIPDSSFCWNELCSAGTHLDIVISAPTNITAMTYAQFSMQHSFSIERFHNGQCRTEELLVRSPGVYKSGSASGTYSLRSGSKTTIYLDATLGQQIHYVVMLPHTCVTEIISIESVAAVNVFQSQTAYPRWTHYGSSISHGMQVTAPDKRWPEQVATRLQLKLKDFSISGNAQLDPAMARNIAEIPTDMISCAIGINIVNSDSMRERTFVPALHGFLDIIREQQPYTPILLMTACSCPIQENSPGPTFMNDKGFFVSARRDIENDIGALTLQRTRELVESVFLARHDNHLVLIDGRSVFGAQDAELLDDHLHPNAVGIQRITVRMCEVLSHILKDDKQLRY